MDRYNLIIYSTTSFLIFVRLLNMSRRMLLQMTSRKVLPPFLSLMIGVHQSLGHMSHQVKQRRIKKLRDMSVWQYHRWNVSRPTWGLNQLWASLYMFFFNMPWLPEKVMLANNAWLIGRMMNATKRAALPSWMTHTYRSNCLQNSAMASQLNYDRCLIQMAPKPNEDDALGPKKDGSNKKVRRLDLPGLMIRGKDGDALTDDVFLGFGRYLSNSRLVAIDDCSHWIQADCPNEVNMELEKILVKNSCKIIVEQ